MKKLILPLLAVSAFATPAIAAPTITFNTSTALPGYTTAQIFESFENSGTGGAAFTTSTVNVPGTGITATETGSARAQVYQASVPGVASDTDTNPNNHYLSVLGGGTFGVTFSAPVQFFSFILGSLDTYNKLTLTTADGTTTDYLGSNIINQQTTFTPGGNSSVAGRVNYDFGGGSGLVSAVFSSTNDSFEIDALAAAVPEASTWAMMMVGLGLVGGALRRRQKVATRVSFG